MALFDNLPAMEKLDLTASRSDKPENEVGAALMRQANVLRFQCPDGTLVKHPRDCGDAKMLPNTKIEGL